MRLELHPEARAEFRSAALGYDERRTELGDEFIVAVSAALGRNWRRSRILLGMAGHADSRAADPRGDAPATVLAHSREALDEIRLIRPD